MNLHEYQLWCMSNPTNDEVEINRRFHEQSRMIMERYNQQREKEQMIKDITEEVMRRIRVIVNNEASPEIKKIKDDIDKLFVK